MTPPPEKADSDLIRDKGKLRRIALGQQGLLKQAAFGRGKGAVAKAIEHLGYVQIDTISVVERAHHHVLRSRVPNYRPRFLDQLQREGKVFEHWYHAAAYLPMRDYRFARRRMQAFRDRQLGWERSSDHRLMARILERVRAEGPLMSRDFEDTRASRAGWWDWKPAKRALEQLFAEGELMIVGRDGFQKTYDLPERALPPDVATDIPDLSEYAAYLVRNTLRSHGFATQKSFTHLQPGAPLRQAVAQALADGVEHGRVKRLQTRDGSLWWADAELLERRAPPAPATVRILSPFDNAVILRHRINALFDFDYQIECYVTAEKRRFGYFCLPLLYRDRLVGRMDCKAHRAGGELNIKQLHIERDVDEGFLTAFASAAADFADFNGCREVSLSQCHPAGLESAVMAHLA